MLSRSPTFLSLTNNLRLIVVVRVQLKALPGLAPQYVVFYYLTIPVFAVRVGQKRG
jgi:hypothetical protein